VAFRPYLAVGLAFLKKVFSFCILAVLMLIPTRLSVKVKSKEKKNIYQLKIIPDNQANPGYPRSI
jgi:hypothetical protein